MKLVTIEKRGNGAGIRLDEEILSMLGLSIGDKVGITTQGSSIVISKDIRTSKQRLDEMLSQCDFSAPCEGDHFWGNT
jgi:antitoxin component of MazEF toxin-antitoxin module